MGTLHTVIAFLFFEFVDIIPSVYSQERYTVHITFNYYRISIYSNNYITSLLSLQYTSCTGTFVIPQTHSVITF